MKWKKKTFWILAASLLVMAILILDTKTAALGAQEGIVLCLRTVIPSLFPFMIISVYMTPALTGQRFACLRPLGKAFQIPSGAENILLIGMLGGYPVGAQLVSAAREEGFLSRKTADRMLAFCSNAGPAFLFGMAGTLFSSGATPWALWSVHITAAWLVSLCFPGQPEPLHPPKDYHPLTVSESMRISVKTMAQVCGWVVCFRILLTFSERWYLWLLPQAVQVLFAGVLELSNGCIALQTISSESLRFVLCAVFLGFGGLAVAMQTVSVCNGQIGLYLPGKLMQASFSGILAFALRPFLFYEGKFGDLLPAIFLISCIFIRKILKNSSRNPVSAGV